MDNFLPPHFRLLEKKFIYNLEHTHNIKINPNIFKKAQIGGGIKYKTKTYEKKHFNFRIDDDDPSDIRIAIITRDLTECVTVFVQPELKSAHLHNMSYYNDCAREGLGKSGGDLLMRVMLTFLIKKREKYNIDRITLSDHSFLYCGENSEFTLKLARLRTITHGKTWPGACPLRSTEYMKYGFLPFNSHKNIPDTDALQWIDYNINTLNVLKTNTIDILKIADDVGVNKNNIKVLMKKYPLFKNFIKKLAEELNIYCHFIDAILDDVYKSTPLHKQILYDWYMKNFYLDINKL